MAVLHEGGVITYWDQENYFKFIHSFKLNSSCSKLVYESSYRYLAALTESKGVEVWKLNGDSEKHWWDLNFKSV